MRLFSVVSDSHLTLILPCDPNRIRSITLAHYVRVGLASPDNSDTHDSNGRGPASTRPQDCIKSDTPNASLRQAMYGFRYSLPGSFSLPGISILVGGPFSTVFIVEAPAPSPTLAPDPEDPANCPRRRRTKSCSPKTEARGGGSSRASGHGCGTLTRSPTTCLDSPRQQESRDGTTPAECFCSPS
jgi:hypothetical protein